MGDLARLPIPIPLLLLILAAAEADDLTLNTTSGAVAGHSTHGGRVRAFTAVPYAAPPVGARRWRRPQPHTPWEGVLDATQAPCGCPQQCSDGGIPGICPARTDEDCLTLSLFVPPAGAAGLYPVMVYFHGGSWLENYGGGSRLNVSNVVNYTQSHAAVLVNYRLGALGMLYDSDLGLEGNFGHYDQIAALEWVYRNCRAFGCDPDSIVVYGESAGANSALLHYVQQGAAHPSRVAGVILESPSPGQRWHTPATWGSIPTMFSELAGCAASLSRDERLSCLMAVAPDKLVEAQGAVPKLDSVMRLWSMTVQTDLFPDQPLLAVQQGHGNSNITVMAGSNECEACLFFGSTAKQNPTAFLRYWAAWLPADILGKVVDFYAVPVSNASANLIGYTIDIQTDMSRRCPTRRVLLHSLQHSPQPARLYHFEYASGHLNKKLYPSNSRCWSRVCHTAELWWVFSDDLSSLVGDAFTPAESLLHYQFLDFWSNFAAVPHDPNKGHTEHLNVSWSAFTKDHPQAMLLDVGDGMKMVDLDSTVCDFWDSTGYTWLQGF